MSWICYILECADGTLYTGITNNPDKRLAAHNAGVASKYTRTRLPVRYVWFETCADRAAASRREVAVKRLSRTAKLELIQAVPTRVESPEITITPTCPGLSDAAG